MQRGLLCLCIGVVGLVAACDNEQTTMPAPDPPAVSTGSTLSVGRDQASVSGAVDPRGLDTVYWFEYGTSDAYGDQTPDTPVSSSIGGTREVAEALTGLQASTDYHYRFAARSSAGTSTGTDATFRTLEPNLVPETFLTAAPSDTSSATVRWHLYWYGTDSDGEASGFELRIANHGPDGQLDPADSLGVAWTSTVATDSLFTWPDDLGSRTAWVRAVDDQGARDPTPAFQTINAVE